MATLQGADQTTLFINSPLTKTVSFVEDGLESTLKAIINLMLVFENSFMVFNVIKWECLVRLNRFLGCCAFFLLSVFKLLLLINVY